MMIKQGLFRRGKCVITPENLRHKAVSRVLDKVQSSGCHSECCPICLKFTLGQPLYHDEKQHIEQTIRYQEQLLIEEFGYRVLPIASKQ